jgi:hypothetical protein
MLRKITLPIKISTET